MLNTSSRIMLPLVLLFSLLLTTPSPGLSEETFGGVSFRGDRQGVCVLIEGECMEESIYFKLDTCDADHNVKEMFKETTPFTLRVPMGNHRLVIMREGEKVISQTITVTPGTITEFEIPPSAAALPNK